MQINFLGESAFKIQSKDVVIVIDPFGPKTGLRLNPLKADIVLTSGFGDQDIKRVKSNVKDSFFIDSPGEYEIKGAFIYGIESEHSVLFSINVERITIAHLGGLSSELSDAQLEIFNNADVLLVPVGGGQGKDKVLTPTQADKIVSQIEPRIVIPMNFKIPELKIEREDVAKFCKEVGAKEEQQEKLVLKRKDLPQEEMEVIVLKP